MCLYLYVEFVLIRDNKGLLIICTPAPAATKLCQIAVCPYTPKTNTCKYCINIFVCQNGKTHYVQIVNCGVS